jgi:hypothetical protein
MEEPMKTIRTGVYPAGRLKRGAAIVAAAEGVDVTVVQKRLDAFASAHLAYTAAHGTVEAAEAVLREKQLVLDRCNRDQDEVLEEVARWLATDGYSRTQPFAALGVDSPSLLKQLNFGEKAKAIHALVSVLHADTTLSAATRRVIEAAEAAARRMEAELVPFDKLQTNLRTARAVREAAGRKWDSALIALKHDARAAAAEGAPDLYAALIGRPSRAKSTAAPDKDEPATGPVTNNPA